MNSATLNLFSLAFFLTFTTTMHSISIRPCWQITKFPLDPSGFWCFFIDLKAVPRSRRCVALKPVPLPCLGFFFWLFSPSALSSSHSPSPFKRWNAPTDGSVIMMCPFSMLESSTSKTATTCEDRYLHMWWEGRDENDVGNRMMGSWYWRMDLCTYYLDTLFTYIYIYIYINAYTGKACSTASTWETTSH